MTIHTLCIFGTRPEAIKMAPLIRELEANQTICNKVCVTGQHQQMLQSMLDQFEITPDYNLQVMSTKQDLSSLTAKILLGLAEVFKHYTPHLVLVHGDTTTTLAASLSAYYHHIPVAHVEAGLRTGDMNSPWPEEANRKLAGALATTHFAPTQRSRINLLQEGVASETIHVTGNTVIDALHSMTNKIEQNPELAETLRQEFPFLNFKRKLLLVTGHRRESFGEGFKSICRALARIAESFPEVDIVYPVHLNPQVQEPVTSLLGNIDNIYLIEPIDYLPFIYLMKSSYLILTDSGGMQEEAPSLGKPVLVMRDKTERPEAIESGGVKLVGTNTEEIVSSVAALLTNSELYLRMSSVVNPYGDGQASARIAHIISQFTIENIPAFSFNPLIEKEAIRFETADTGF